MEQQYEGFPVSDGGIVTTEIDGFTVTSNSAGSEAQLRASLKPKVEAALSKAGSELGKKGAEASAKARSEKPEPESEEKPEPKEAKAKEESKAEPEEPKPAEVADKSAPEEKAEEEEPEAKPEEKKPNPRHDPKARMLEATRKEAEAKRALAEERRRREEIEARLAALERPAPREAQELAPKWSGDSKPSPADFETYEDYLDARDTWNRRQWESEYRQQAESDAITRALDAQTDKFRKIAAPAVGRYSEEVLSLETDFQREARDPKEPSSGPNWIANELVFSPEQAPALMLHFTEHPEDLQRIAALSTPRAVSREMAKLEARLEAATSGDSTKRDDDVSRAAPPVRPVTGKPYVSEAGEYRPGMSLDEYAKVWSKQNRRR